MAVVRLAVATRDAMTNTAVDLLDGGSGPGYCEIRSGTQPATGDTAPTGSVLATVTFSDPAFGSSSSGTAQVDDTPALTVAASATGTASWARFYDSNGNKVFDIDVTVSGGGGAMTVNTTALVSGVNFTITAIAVTQPAS